MKIVVRILIFLVVAYLLTIPWFIDGKRQDTLCGRVVVNIIDSAECMFVTPERILDMVNSRSDSVLGRPVGSISADALEKRISGIREIRDVDVWIDIDGTMNIEVDQRNPVMRVIPDDGGDYLVDDEGILFKSTVGHPPRLHIVGGNIKITRAMLEGVSITDSTMAGTSLRDAFDFVNYINKDKFWSAQIDQIYINNKGGLELVPRVGRQIIKLGSLEGYATKLENLMLFYEQVVPETGWDSYSEINLEYSNQIVCKKRL